MTPLLRVLETLLLQPETPASMLDKMFKGGKNASDT